MNVWLPSLEQVIIIHERLILHTGGSAGIRDIGLIDSALARASAAYGGVEAYPGLIAKAAAIACGLTQNHGFIDGNKRIGVTTMLLTIQRNGVRLQYTQDELICLGLQLAQGRADVSQVEAWIRAHIVQ